MGEGRFITIEGGEGAGKSTQIGRLHQALQTAGIDVVVTREPGGAPSAEAIRTLLVEGATDRWDGWTEALLHSAARREHLVNTVWPALDAGKWVISDRYADSTMAYQGFGHGLDRDALIELYALTAGDFFPDLTLIVDLPVEVGLRRAKARGGADRYERMGVEFHERIREGFRVIAGNDPDRCRLIDGTGGEESVAAAIAWAVRERFGLELA